MSRPFHFFLVTPAKNEANHIGRVIESIVQSSTIPDHWIIVDDNSTDSTSEIATKASQEHSWISVIPSSRTGEYDWLAYADVVTVGITALEKELIGLDAAHTYVSILDADIWVEPSYFEMLITMLETQLKQGVVSGDIYIVRNGEWVVEDKGAGPRGGARVHRWACLKDIGGYPRTPSPDSVTDFRARRRGWREARLRGSKAFQARPTFGHSSIKTSYIGLGRGRYRLRMSAVTALCSTLLVAWQKGLGPGLWFMVGYTSAFVHREEMVPDQDVSEMFGWSWKRIVTTLLFKYFDLPSFVIKRNK